MLKRGERLWRIIIICLRTVMMRRTSSQTREISRLPDIQRETPVLPQFGDTTDTTFESSRKDTSGTDSPEQIPAIISPAFHFD